MQLKGKGSGIHIHYLKKIMLIFISKLEYSNMPLNVTVTVGYPQTQIQIIFFFFPTAAR